MDNLMQLLLKAGQPAGTSIKDGKNLPAPRLLANTPDQDIGRHPYSNILKGLVFGNNQHPTGHGVPLLDGTGPAYNLPELNLYSNGGKPWYENDTTGQQFPVVPPTPFADQQVFLPGANSMFTNRRAIAQPQMLRPSTTSLQTLLGRVSNG